MNFDLQAEAEHQASYCRIFANAKRILILWTLAADEKSVGEIATAIDASLQSTSQHLHLMKHMGILDSRRDGQTIYYHVVKGVLGERCDQLHRAGDNGR